MSNRSRFAPVPNNAITATVDNDHQAAPDVAYRTAAENLKKLKSRLAIAQMPGEDAGIETTVYMCHGVLCEFIFVHVEN